ncbi:MAG: beta-lactamase family protein [Tenericutes bacterium]|nr:beta-lactamase family protein [Mycoplasmatota bacterium]
MKKNVLLIFMILAVFNFLSACSRENQIESSSETGVFSVSEDGGENADKFFPALNQIENWVKEGEIVGAEMLVIENSEIVVHEAYGWKDKEEGKPMVKDTIFRIRSMTKPFIATSILMLAEEGRLDLSDPVSKYLHSFSNDSSSSVRIEHLLTHTGGFSQPGFPRDYETYKSLREAVDDIGTHGPQFHPGTRYIYSDGGVAVLGAVIAEVSGMPLEDYIQKMILEPLEMNDTYCFLTEDKDIRDRISATYYRDGKEFVKYWDSSMPQSVDYFRASGGMYSTPLDYAKFLYMWMNNGMVDSKEYLSEQSILNALTPGSLNGSYGYLWEIDNSFGHGGSDGTIAFALPDEDIMVLYFTQSRSTHTAEVVKSMILKEFGKRESPDYTRFEVAEVDYYDDYIGRYQNTLVEIEITSNGKDLLVKTADSSNQIFIPASKNFFSHEILDIQLSFTRDSSGEITGLIIYQKGERIEATKIE